MWAHPEDLGMEWWEEMWEDEPEEMMAEAESPKDKKVLDLEDLLEEFPDGELPF